MTGHQKWGPLYRYLTHFRYLPKTDQISLVSDEYAHLLPAAGFPQGVQYVVGVVERLAVYRGVHHQNSVRMG